MECSNQGREIFPQRAPYNVEVDVAIRMDQPVTHVDHVSPRKSGQVGLCFGGHLRRCLADDLDAFDHGQNKLAVGLEIVPGSASCER